MSEKKSTLIQVRVNEEELEKIDEIAEKLACSRPTVLHMLIKNASVNLTVGQEK